MLPIESLPARGAGACCANTAALSRQRATPYALYGYEAMSVVLASIRAAGNNGDDRQAVIDKFFATHERHSVLGALLDTAERRNDSVDAMPSTVCERRRPVFWRALQHLACAGEIPRERPASRAQPSAARSASSSLG